MFIDRIFEEKTINALKWIINILDNHAIPYQISGGFAGKIFGSKRELHDINKAAQDYLLNLNRNL